MKEVLNLILILAFAAPTATDSQCVTCPGGIENPGADASGFGLYTCEEVDGFFQASEGVDCVNIQFQVAPLCCPSLIAELGKNNSCGWCPNGLPDPFANFSLPGESDTLTCINLLNLATTGADVVSGTCDLVQPAAEICCPGDSSGVGFDCPFCTGGVEFPDKIIADADNATCSDIEQFAVFFNQSLCEAAVLPLISECCPNSLPSPTDPPVATDPPTILEPTCEFCPLGVESTGAVLPFVEGTMGATCEDFQISAKFLPADKCAESIKPLEGLCCPSTTTNPMCEWCSGELGLENPFSVFPVVDLTCAEIGNLVKAVPPGELCNEYQQAEGVCCPDTADAIQCDFCSGPDGVEFPEKEIDDNGLTCSDFATFALGAPNAAFCAGAEAAQGLCCPASTGVSLPPVAEGEYCYLCGNASTEMTKPDFQPYAVLGSDDPEDSFTCAEIEQQINSERGEEESCASALASFTLLYSPSICGCAGVEPPNPCKFCDGRSVKRDVVLPAEDGITCGQGYDLLLHFTSDLRCDAPNTSFEDAEKICCGDALVDEEQSSAYSFGTEIFAVVASLLVVFVA